MSTPDSKDTLKPHDYDGIREYDNQLPRWWLGTFFLTLIFGLGYWIYYHITSTGPTQASEYSAAVSTAARSAASHEASEATFDAEAVAVLVKDAAAMTAAKTVFSSHCMACHGPNAQGGIGPNLTDAYWIHGGSPDEIYRTIEHGVSAKGMPTWHGLLSGAQMRALAAYLITLQGTTPPNPKAPEGERVP